jgi:hypothetical protein
MRTSSIALVVAAGVTSVALMRSNRLRNMLRREAELLGLRAYLNAIDRGASHSTFISDIRNADCMESGAWLVRAYGKPCAEEPQPLPGELVGSRQN